ncbi:MAG: glycosyltransferase family 2 protein [Candidatus Omnitrophota bacterium]
MNNPKISVVVLTKNEEDKIERFLKSVMWADEILVIDDESTDKTRKLCELYGARVIVNKLNNNFCVQRNIGIKNAENEWILQMDADEEVPAGTVKKIRDAVNNPNDYSAFQLLRKNFMFGYPLKYGGAYNYSTKLFKKEKGIYSENIHEVLNIKGPIGTINAELYHYPYVSVNDILHKMMFYTDMEASKEVQKHGKFSLKEIKYRLTWKSLKLFWKLYVKKQGYKDGMYGLVWAVINVMGPQVRWLKIWEKTRSVSRLAG